MAAVLQPRESDIVSESARFEHRLLLIYTSLFLLGVSLSPNVSLCTRQIPSSVPLWHYNTDPSVFLNRVYAEDETCESSPLTSINEVPSIN